MARQSMGALVANGPQDTHRPACRAEVQHEVRICFHPRSFYQADFGPTVQPAQDQAARVAPGRGPRGRQHNLFGGHAPRVAREV
eukprot:9296706-Pyramimonas_sp.AAC.1